MKKETPVCKKDFCYVIGIDEAGRGPVAGPVAVGVAAIPLKQNIWSYFEKLKDSKKLSEKRREEWFALMEEAEDIYFQVAMVSAAEIDKKGIVPAITSALNQALAKLADGKTYEMVLLDGGLKAPATYQQKTIIQGDEKEPVIALASIAAKVARDRYMRAIDSTYKQYDFNRHKGYGTKAHYEAIKEHGICTEHRKSFLTRVLS